MSTNPLFIQDLKLHLQGDLLIDKASLGIYATDASVYQIEPIAIVLPKHEADVQIAVKIAADHGISILPRGGGTSLAGQTIGHSMILDFSKYMNQILELNEKEGWVRVQPGLVRDELNAFLKNKGWHFAPDPATSSRANIGGMIGNNSSGTKSILYGKTVDHIMELKVVLSDGTILNFKELSIESFNKKAQQDNREGIIYQTFKNLILEHEAEILTQFPKVMRRVQGYNLDEFAGQKNWNLSQLICGSEGTLATILEAKINLEPLPKFKSVCVVHFAEVLEAIQAVTPMLQFQPSAIEILDDTVIRLSRENLLTKRHAHFIEGHPAAIQIVEFYGNTLKEVMERPKQMITQLKALNLGYAYPLFSEGEAYNDVWLIRKKGLGLMLGLKGGKKPLPFIEDAGIPTDVLPEYIDRVLKICKKHQTEAAMYAHASVGVIHVRPILDLRLAEDIERFKKIADETFELVKEYKGSWSGEHGDGLVRSFYLERYFGEQIYGVLRQVKQLFDPNNLMNPGKIIDGPPIDENLRYGTKYKEKPIETVFKYREDGSFSNAVHMCTGVGECRKMLGGTMCPSFKATREEEHSTRGRANALRLAMSGQLDEEGLNSPRLKEALDLCLSCKACKSECPSNVDMAKLKSEVLQKQYDKKGTSLRDRMIRDSADMAAKMSGNFAPIINGIIQTNLARWTMDKILGLDKKRTMPSYAKQSFVQWYHKNYALRPQANQQVVLFADTYLNYHEPQVGIAATRLLDACGFEVLVADVGCCQRPKISHGFLKAAKREGTKVAQKLNIFLKKGLKIVVCEPSCVSALIDDLPDLLDDSALAKNLSKNVQAIDVFLAEQIQSKKINVTFSSTIKKLTLHGHCHQKALTGTKHLKYIFSQIKDLEVKELNTGCCGMAGSFGYEKEHYQLSKKIAERVLLPALKKQDKGVTLVADGFSCRHQVGHFDGQKAKHWVEVIRVHSR